MSMRLLHLLTACLLLSLQVCAAVHLEMDEGYFAIVKGTNMILPLKSGQLQRLTKKGLFGKVKKWPTYVYESHNQWQATPKKDHSKHSTAEMQTLLQTSGGHWKLVGISSQLQRSVFGDSKFAIFASDRTVTITETPYVALKWSDLDGKRHEVWVPHGPEAQIVWHKKSSKLQQIYKYDPVSTGKNWVRVDHESGDYREMEEIGETSDHQRLSNQAIIDLVERGETVSVFGAEKPSQLVPTSTLPQVFISGSPGRPRARIKVLGSGVFAADNGYFDEYDDAYTQAYDGADELESELDDMLNDMFMAGYQQGLRATAKHKKLTRFQY